jgi:hypothetical protein
MSEKIVPLRGHFENMQALLARIAEDTDAIGFVGMVILKEGRGMKLVNFNVSCAEMAYAGAALSYDAIALARGRIRTVNMMAECCVIPLLVILAIWWLS